MTTQIFNAPVEQVVGGDIHQYAGGGGGDDGGSIPPKNELRRRIREMEWEKLKGTLIYWVLNWPALFFFMAMAGFFGYLYYEYMVAGYPSLWRFPLMTQSRFHYAFFGWVSTTTICLFWLSRHRERERLYLDDLKADLDQLRLMLRRYYGR
jgi:hypothetical protein